MKKVLFRKLLNDYLSFFFIALLSTSLVIWVFQAVNYLDIMIEDGRDYMVYIKFSLLNFPKIISKVFPFALFFSVFYVTDRYEQNNELMIFWNFGVNKKRTCGGCWSNSALELSTDDWGLEDSSSISSRK